MSAKKSLYKTIETELLDKINRGYYKIGSPIPTENELALKYNVSRVTVRQATNNLVANGILVRNQGVGTFVSKVTPVVERTVKIMGFREEMESSGKKVNTDVLTFEVIIPDKTIAEKLLLGESEPVYHMVRLRKADNKPMVIETTYMSVSKYPDVNYTTMKGSKYDYIEKSLGLEIDYSHHILIPILANNVIANLFEIEIDSPVIKVLNTTYLKNGDVLDYTELILNSGVYQYVAIKTR